MPKLAGKKEFFKNLERLPVIGERVTFDADGTIVTGKIVDVHWDLVHVHTIIFKIEPIIN